MSILFFDTETTGFANYQIEANDPRQARVVQFAAILTEEDGTIRNEISALVSPGPDIEIPARATEIHGITTERARSFGLNERTALNVLDDLAMRCKVIVAHNIDFDCEMMWLMYKRDDRVVIPFCSDLELFPRRYCTMNESTHHCKIPGRRDDYKWPKLQEAHKHFFGSEFEGAHDALSDVRACMRIYFHLKTLEPKQENANV